MPKSGESSSLYGVQFARSSSSQVQTEGLNKESKHKDKEDDQKEGRKDKDKGGRTRHQTTQRNRGWRKRGRR